jgi:hypothetical protein
MPDPPEEARRPVSRWRRAIVFRHACKMGLEGIVSKRLRPRYVSGRTCDWLKMKNPAAPAVKRPKRIGFSCFDKFRRAAPPLRGRMITMSSVTRSASGPPLKGRNTTAG